MEKIELMMKVGIWIYFNLGALEHYNNIILLYLPARILFLEHEIEGPAPY